MEFDRYANLAAENAAELVNLHRDQQEPSLADVQELLEGLDLALQLKRSHLPGLAALAEDLAGVFEADDLDRAISRLNDLLDSTPMSPRISTHDGRGPHLHVESEGADVVQRLRANCLMGLAAVLCDGGRLRLGVCAAGSCDRVWLDTSRNARRRFCSDRCATRTHVAAHRARQAAR